MIRPVLPQSDGTGESPAADAEDFAGWLASKKAARNVSIGTLAVKIGVSKSRVHEWLNGALPEYDNAAKAADAFGEDANVVWALVRRGSARQQAAPSVDHLPGQPIKVPIVQDLTASLGAGNGYADAYIAYYPATYEVGHQFLAIEVRGDCMEPLIHAGQIAIVDMDAAPSHGKMVLIDDPEDGLLIKELQRRDGFWWGVPQQGTPKLTSLGRVRGVVRATQRFW